MVDNGMEDSICCDNIVFLSRQTLMANDNNHAKVIIDEMLGETHLHPSIFFLSDKIIDYARKMWNEEDFNFCVKVDVHVFVYDLPPQHDSGIDGDVDSEDYMDNMTINFVAASEQSIERLEKVLIKDDQIVCSICFENVHVGLEATKLPCTHTYHEKCIVQWLQTSKFCPMCRFEIVLKKSFLYLLHKFQLVLNPIIY